MEMDANNLAKELKLRKQTTLNLIKMTKKNSTDGIISALIEMEVNEIKNRYYRIFQNRTLKKEVEEMLQTFIEQTKTSVTVIKHTDIAKAQHSRNTKNTLKVIERIVPNFYGNYMHFEALELCANINENFYEPLPQSIFKIIDNIKLTCDHKSQPTVIGKLA
jgi:hypothetical protein